MAFEDWSTNPANNQLVGSINWSEGQLPGTVNGSARQMMADLATWRDQMAQTIETLSAALPIGSKMPFGGSVAPAGWLLCYGQAVSRTTYADLFAVIGTTNGAGDGSTTFNLPDHRGRVSAGKDNMGGVSANRLASIIDGDILGATGGAETHTLTTAQMPSHNHGGSTGSAGTHTHNVNAFLASTAGGTPGAAFEGGTLGAGVLTSAAGDHSHSIAAEGGGQAHANVQPTIIDNIIIRTGVL